VILDYLPISTNHQAIIERDGRWWFFYHDKLLPGGGDHRRSITLAPLRYGEDGAILPITRPAAP
jgi:hypothetical protein